VYTLEVFRSYRKGYLVVSALLVVAVAMLYATATLASMKALRNESGWSQSRTQEQAAARSATAKMVAEFNKAGSLEEGGYEGEIFGIPYTAELKVDPNHSSVFHLTARVGESEFTRVLRQEPRSLHLAFARTGLVTDPTLYMQSNIDGDWETLPLPPEQPGDLNRIPATTSNYQGELFAFRFGTRLHPTIPTPFLSKYDVEMGTWSDLPPIPYHFRQSLEERDGWTMETYSRQSVLAANNDKVFTILGPNNLVNRRAPDSIAEFFVYEMEQERWHAVERPTVDVYDARGQLVSDSDEVSIDQLVASEDQFLVEMSGSDPVSTLYRFKDDRWTMLPPLSTSGKAISIACGPGGKISAVMRGVSGEISLVRMVDGKWQAADKPTGHNGVLTVAIDSEGREWIQDMREGKLYRSLRDGWEEKTMPDGLNREVDLGAKPDDKLFYYQTTTGY
jgi:hypothetical protein